MIKMKSPSLVINSHDAPFPKYKMWETINADEGMNVTMLVNEIIRVYRVTLEDEDSGLSNIIINCHGSGGVLSIGGKGRYNDALTIQNVPYFSLLKKRRIGTIWLVACEAAKGSWGKELCLALAFHTSSLVVASDESQDTGLWGGYRVFTAPLTHHIDEFEGTVFGFYPSGSVSVIDPHDVQTILD